MLPRTRDEFDQTARSATVAGIRDARTAGSSPARVSAERSLSSPDWRFDFTAADHESAGNALGKIREITNDFAVPEHACVTYLALMAGLGELEQDLHMHIHLENNILFPRAQQLEASGR